MGNKYKKYPKDVDFLLREFGNTVQRLRGKLDGNITQEELAERADLHRTYIGAVERGEINITLFNICKIALALNVKPAQLMDFEEETLNAIADKLQED